jgi:DTW domain-containing protein YfiP
VQTTVLLYPSRTSVHARDFVRDLRQAAVAATSTSSGAGAVSAGRVRVGIHLIVVDGTWTQAKKMCKSLMSLPHIHIDVDDHTTTLYTPLRKVRYRGGGGGGAGCVVVLLSSPRACASPCAGVG